jgi:hypothetical protein
MTPIETILTRLKGVRQVGPGRWVARCPSHEDRSPSLSVREGEDLRVLLHDFAGCEPEAIVQALGLELRDLFPPQDKGRPWNRRPRGAKPAPDPFIAWEKRTGEHLDAWHRAAFLGIGQFHELLTQHAADGPLRAAIENILARLYDLEQAAEMAIPAWAELGEMKRREMFAERGSFCQATIHD